MSLRRAQTSEAEKILAELRRFNEVGFAAIKRLNECAEDLSRRLVALEEFQKTLVTPGDKSKAS